MNDLVYACVQQVLKSFGFISPIHDHFIADNKLVIVFDNELRIEDVELMQRLLDGMPECHSVLDDVRIGTYGGNYKSVVIDIKGEAENTFKRGGNLMGKSKFDEGGTIPKQLMDFPNTIDGELGIYHKSLVTPDFTFYSNFDEGDENGNTLMYRNDGSLVSDNYFANVGLMEELENEDQNYIFIHKNLFDYLEEYRNN